MAINFGLANDYNVFVFGDLNLSNTDAEGRVAVGGNATLSNYGVGAGITPLPPANTDPSFVVDGSVDVTGGSNASGNTVINPNSSVINYTMGNPNGQLITAGFHRTSQNTDICATFSPHGFDLLPIYYLSLSLDTIQNLMPAGIKATEYPAGINL